MGKKHRKSKSSGVESEDSIPRNVRRETLEICSLLLEKCSVGFGCRNGSTEWGDFLEVYNIVQKLRKKQQNYLLIHVSRDESIADFITWAKSNGVKFDKVALTKLEERGYGLKATKNLNDSEMCLSVPHKLMMTTETAKSSALGSLINSDRLLQSMPNVVLALHVLCEFTQGDSFWQPYLSSLPSVYTTPLYFTPDELQHLKGSPLLSECLNQFRSIARQYAYFYRVFQGHPDMSKLPIKYFCYDDYRWAVSTVMTRQNEIPIWRGSDTSDDKTASNAATFATITPAAPTAAKGDSTTAAATSTAKSAAVTAAGDAANTVNTAEAPVDATEAITATANTASIAGNATEATAACKTATAKAASDSDKESTEVISAMDNSSDIEKALEGSSGETSDTIAKTQEDESIGRQTALIPVWDMCNHTNGHITTEFNVETGCCDCYTLQKHKKGEEVCIFYGARSNAELLLHSGFVYEDNSFDRLAIRLGLSRNDPVYSLKAEVLARVVPSSTTQIFYLHSDPLAPVDGDMLAYLRIFSLDKDALFGMLVGERAMARQEAVRKLDFMISVENEKKAWSFLQARCEILIRAYPTTLQEDDRLLSEHSLDGENNKAAVQLNEHSRLMVRLRRCEKRILVTAAEYAIQRLEIVKSYEQDMIASELGKTKLSNDAPEEPATESVAEKVAE